MRRGVVLFITLSVIVSMLALVGVIFSYLDKVKQNSSHGGAIIQANLFFRDTNEALKVLLKKVGTDTEKRKTILSTLYTAPLSIEIEEGNLFITTECHPMNRAVDINWLGYEDNSSMELQYSASQELFDTLVEQYSIENPSLLLEKILLAIRGEAQELNPTRLQAKKGIVSLGQLQKIVREYQFESDDSKVDEIIWEKFFSFDRESTLIDGGYLSAELIAILFEMEIELVHEEWFEGDELKTFVGDHGGSMENYNRMQKLFSPTLIERIHCRVTYGYEDKVYSFGLDYLDEKADRFEFYAEQ